MIVRSTGRWIPTATYGANNFSELRLEQLDILCESADMVLNRHMPELCRAEMRSWNGFVKAELLKGGGLLFKYIAKEDKDFMKVDLAKLGGEEYNPSDILKQQSLFWAKYWAPSGEDAKLTKDADHRSMETYRKFALPQAAAYNFTLQGFFN